MLKGMHSMSVTMSDMPVLTNSIKITKKTGIILRPHLMFMYNMNKLLRVISKESHQMDGWTDGHKHLHKLLTPL